MKKYRKFIINLTKIIACLMVISCSDNNEVGTFSDINTNESGLPSFEDYLKLHAAEKVPGSILIESNNTMVMQEISPSVYITEKRTINDIDDKNGNYSRIRLFNEEGHEIFDLKNSKNSNVPKDELLSLFGNEFHYSFGEAEKNGMAVKSIYAPDLIDISINTTDARAGSIISWNIDPNNENGVILYAQYEPTEQNDLTLAEQNLNRITRGIVLPDKQGQYVIKQSDLERFPDNSYVDIVVLRGTSTQTTSKAPSITTISKVTASMQINR